MPKASEHPWTRSVRLTPPRPVLGETKKAVAKEVESRWCQRSRSGPRQCGPHRTRALTARGMGFRMFEVASVPPRPGDVRNRTSPLKLDADHRQE
jgi:hypothetical protein